MITALKNWKGSVVVNGENYDSIESAISAFKTSKGPIHIKLSPKKETVLKIDSDASQSIQSISPKLGEIQITVKKYMTETATPLFDFMAKWNNNNPMPMRIMTGTKEKETRGMVYMKLHGLAKPTITCCCCGKELTNPISRKYGIGPICLSKIGINLDINDVDGISEKLVDVKWEGWIIKSAITKEEEV